MRFLLILLALSYGSVAGAPIHAHDQPRWDDAPNVADVPIITPTEAAFLAVPDANSARTSLETITKYAHVAGTVGDYESAKWVQDQLHSYGLNPKLDIVNTLLNFPINSSLQLISGGAPFTAQLSEDIYPLDPTSDTPLRNHTFHGYGPSGNVTGKLVYVNYGTIEDFNYLKQHGVSVQGAIVIVRYGTIFRGIKVKHAQENGAIGCLIFSDPYDDGYLKGPVYTDGPWRPASGVQRGSVQFNSLCAGDPGMTDRTPGICGNYTTADLIPRIPSLPISYGDALPLLAAISGVESPQAWHGGLNVSYNIGPGPATVRLEIVNEFTTAPIWNVITEIPGGEFPEQKVILGNHRDAWVYGAVDPNSGTAALLEVAKGLSALLKTGWKPKRTIVLCSWDGEEYGLLGSTGWGEKNADDLKTNGVAYLNVDVGVDGGNFGGSVTPSLFGVMTGVLQNIIDPNTNSSVFNKWDKKYGRLGSGSDYTVFLDHLGIASTDFGYNGGYGVYHSVYDSFFWQDHFGDPGFIYHRACAQTWGLLALRIADVTVLPFNYVDYSLQLIHYVEEIQSLAISHDMKLDLSTLISAVWTHALVAEKVETYRQQILSSSSPSPVELLKLNQHLFRAERSFVDDRGIPLRPWFKHVIQAPGLDEGYAANIFPGIIQYINTGNVTNAQSEVERVAGFIHAQQLYLQEVLSNDVQMEVA